MFTALLFILVLVVLIISHEFGHFLAAKLFGVQVDEFGLGFPPRIFSKQYGETLYSINWIPFGGFVKIVGEEGDVDNPRSFTIQPAYKKVVILSAGVIGNLLLAWFLLSVSLQTGLLLPVEGIAHPEYLTNQHVVVGFVAEDSPAKLAGIVEGDQIIAGTVLEVIQNVKASAGKSVSLQIIHAGKKDAVAIAIKPEMDNTGVFRIGVALDSMGEAHYPFFIAVAGGVKMTVNFTEATLIGLYQFATGLFAKESTAGQVSGPVGIFKMVGSASDMGLAYVLAFMALLSINLAVLNILPIPALDGGRVLFVIIEKIKGSPLSPKFTQNVHSVGFALLILLMLVISIHDVVKLF